jgi:hypothetical protein
VCRGTGAGVGVLRNSVTSGSPVSISARACSPRQRRPFRLPERPSGPRWRGYGRTRCRCRSLRPSIWPSASARSGIPADRSAAALPSGTPGAPAGRPRRFPHSRTTPARTTTLLGTLGLRRGDAAAAIRCGVHASAGTAGPWRPRRRFPLSRIHGARRPRSSYPEDAVEGLRAVHERACAQGRFGWEGSMGAPVIACRAGGGTGCLHRCLFEPG